MAEPTTNPGRARRGRVEIECDHCGARVTIPASEARRGQRHCSAACREAAAVAARTYRCGTCGAVAVAERGRQRFCSPECARLDGTPAETGPCASCGRVAELTYRAHGDLCCSARCARSARGHHRRAAIEAAGEQRCSRCGEVRPLEAFDRIPISADAPAYRTYCRECARSP